MSRLQRNKMCVEQALDTVESTVKLSRSRTCPSLTFSRLRSQALVAFVLLFTVMVITDEAAGQLCDPQTLSSLPTIDEGTGVAVVGSTVYVADANGGLLIIDVSTPTAPVLVGSYDTPGHAFDVVVEGTTAYVGDGPLGLQIIDISDPAVPTLLGSYTIAVGSVRNLCLVGSTAYLAARTGGVLMVDVSDPTTPVLVGSDSGLADVWDVASNGSIACVAGVEEGLQVLDVSDPSSATLLGSYDTPGKARGVVLVGTTAYIADGPDGGLQILDVSDPAAPAYVGSYDTPVNARHVDVVGSIAYVADHFPDGNLEIFDVSDPTSPTLLGTWVSPIMATDVVVKDFVAYVVTPDSGLHIVDVSECIPPEPKAARFSNPPVGYLTVADDPSLEPSTFTIEGWVRPLGPGDGGTLDDAGAVFFAKTSPASGAFAATVALMWSPVTEKINAVLAFGAPTALGVIATSTTTVQIDECAHVAMVFDGGFVHLYLNGVLESSVDYPHASTDWGDFPFYIGAGNACCGFPRRFDGVLDDLRFWDHARTAPEISLGMGQEVTGPQPGLLAAWNFNGDSVGDVSGNGHDSTITGLVEFVEPECTALGYGGCWLQQKLNGSDAVPNAWFGNSVSISDDVAVVAALYDAPVTFQEGSAFVFRFNGSDWVEEQMLTASDAAEDDRFGHSAAISGNVIVVGAAYDDDAGSASGSAYVFRYDGTSWVEEQKLTASDAGAVDFFGWAVAVDDDVIVVSAAYDDDSFGQSGSAYVFRFDGTSWIEEQKLNASDPGAGDRFGHSVSASGDVVLVGSPFSDPSGVSNSGSSYVFRFDGTSWSEEQKLIASDGAVSDEFGSSVSVSMDIVLVGAPKDDDGGVNSGSAYVYRFDGASWMGEPKMTASDAEAGDDFGRSVSVSSGVAVVGAAVGDSSSVTNSGCAYIYRYDGLDWLEEQKLTTADATGSGVFGESVSVSGDHVLVGARNTGDPSGSAYVHVLSTDTVSITEQPQSQPQCENQELQLTVTASGSGGLEYQWLKDGLSIAGETTDTLTIVSFQAADVGSYSVIVSDDCGLVLSDDAEVWLLESVSIGSQPVSQELCAGETASFSVGATGALSYQWLLDGSPIAGADASLYEIASVGVADSGDYSCLVTGDCDSVETVLASLILSTATTVNTQPLATNVCVDALLTLTVGASGAALTYQWRLDGVDLVDQTDALLSISAAQLSDSGSYDCVVTGTCGALTSEAVTVVVDQCFIRGDSNGDGNIDVGDAIHLLDYSFGGATADCLRASNANGDAGIDIGDAITILNYLFAGADDLPAPFPDCGAEPAASGLPCDIYTSCP